MERYICIHGHFYQPPRENPWLEDIELQDSAAPFHDWNERVAAECYEPNRAARILDGQGRITRIVNNYARISFNFGPTLLSWMERHRPQTYRAILDADAESRERFSGHGAALAQAYNHLIMPLANRRDKRTQVRWGIADFERRFGRRPEGMWLPETAVDLETLELLAEAGIAFTILAPHQARRVRRIGEKGWRELTEGIDPRLPYRCPLPSGATIDLFFYDGPIARDVAFGGLLNDGETFARRVAGVFTRKERPELVHIATDGESYGHHHRFGEMALAYGLNYLEERELARLTIYGEFLAKHPPQHEVEIEEETSWSCAHGVERWRADCGCRIHPAPGWNQAWRGPLREALDWLRDRLIPLYEEQAAPLLGDPWQARDDYIEVVLDRSPEKVRDFFGRRAGRELDREEQVRALRLLEMQRHAMLMYTSCGWFFDEISGIETTQILGYAGRALQLALEVGGPDLEGEFRQRLAQAPSNLPKWKSGDGVFEQAVLPTRLDLLRVAAHHAIASEFEGNHQEHQVYCYSARNLDYERLPAGRMMLAIGHTRVRSGITWNQGEFCFAVLHLGGHNLNAGISPFCGDGEFAALRRELREAFEKSDIAEVYRLLDRHFGSHNFTLWHLFRDEQRKVLHQVMEETLGEVETSFRQIYQNHFTLLRFLREIRMPIPAPLAAPAELVLSSEMRRLLEDEEFDPKALRSLADEADKLGLRPNRELLRPAAEERISDFLARLAARPQDQLLMQTAEKTLALLQSLELDLDLWQAQNAYFDLHREHGEERARAAKEGDKAAQQWLRHFRALGQRLRIGVV